MDVKVSKDQHISKWVHWGEVSRLGISADGLNLIYVTCIALETVHKVEIGDQ